MGGMSSSNPLVQIGATALDFYTGVPVASMALKAGNAAAQQRSANAQRDAMQYSYDLQQTAMQRQLEQQVRERQNLLKKTLASQRARLAAMGISSGGGSADALVAGLSKQAASDIADMEGSYGDRKASLDFRRQQEMGEKVSSLDVWGPLLAPVAQSILLPKDNEQETSRRRTVQGGSLL